MTVRRKISRKVIVIEVTCLCEENMESWHSINISKYLALKIIIESIGWFVELFAVGVAAREYCSMSLLHTVSRNWVSIKQIFNRMFFLYLAN